MNQVLKSEVAFPPILGFKEKALKGNLTSSDYFDFSQAVPNFPTFEKIRKKIVDLILHDKNLSFYSDVAGLKELRTAISETHPLKDSFKSDQILITAGANHALFQNLILELNPGDEVLLPTPFYFNHDMALKMLGFKPKYFSLSPEDSFKLKADALISHLEKNPNIKAIILVTPNNPTGAMYEASEILKLLKFTGNKKISLMLDETYLKFDPHHLKNPEIGKFLNQNLFLLGSFSKTYSLTGYRVGYWIVPSSKMQDALKIQDTSVICAATVSQYAALEGILSCEDDFQKELNRIESLKKLLIQETKSLKNFKLISCGAFFAYLKHPHKNLNAEEAALQLFEKTKILGLPGSVFGTDQNSFIRLSFCNVDEKKLKLALHSLSNLDTNL